MVQLLRARGMGTSICFRDPENNFIEARHYESADNQLSDSFEHVKGLMAAMRSMLFWTLFPFVIPQAIRVRRNAPRLSGAAGASSGYVGSGRSVRLLAIGDSIIAGVGADTVAEALPGQVAEELAALHECQVSWTASGLIGATSSGLMSCLLRNLMTVC